MNWTGEHRTFIVETFIKTNESVTATQQAFHLQSQRYTVIALNLLNNLKMQFVKKLLPFHMK